MNEITSNLAMNIGIERISVQDAAAPQEHLPAGNSVLPGEGAYQLQLQKVLYDPTSIEQRLVSSLRPDLQNRSLLMPTVYPAMFSKAKQRLKKMLPQM